MPLRDFPNPVAHYNEFFLFTTLTPKQVEAHGRAAYRHPHSGLPCSLSSLDDDMRYIPFAKDYGPLNLAYTFEACLAIHTKLNNGRPVCMYTSTEPKMKSNMALLVGLYCVIVGRNSAYESFGPLAEMEMRMFRDAGNAAMEFGISIQDCLYGVEKAMDVALLDMSDFDPDTYRFYEQVDNGDLNVLGPFIPFASPVDELWVKKEAATKDPSDINLAAYAAQRTIARNKPRSRFPNHTFRCVMQAFKDEQVGLVVRLNNDLYDRKFFLDAGMSHIDLYFDDGSNPSDDIVRHFIRLSEDVIERQGKRVAVHCKAGLGRTGVLIGAYFIYKYGFSAQEVIAFMRIVRPGMVVGPQQQYMVANQMKWVGWAAHDAVLREFRRPAEQNNVFALHTPPLEIEPLKSSTTAVASRARQRSVESHSVNVGPSRQVSSSSTKCGDAVGQPRKGTGPVRADGITARPDNITARPERINEVEEGAEVQHISTRFGYRDPINSSSQPSRGTKRGATRVPVDNRPTPSSSRTHTTTTSHLEIPSSTLVRSTSTASMQSTTTDIDDRAHKRRPLKTPSPMRAEARAYHHDMAESEPLTPSRKVNIKVIEEVTIIESKVKGPRPQRNGSEMVRPPVTSSPGTPLSKLKFSIARKSPPTEEISVIPAAPELARTKGTSREGTLNRAGRDLKDQKEKEKMTSSPRFGARLLSRLGATG